MKEKTKALDFYSRLIEGSKIADTPIALKHYAKWVNWIRIEQSGGN